MNKQPLTSLHESPGYRPLSRTWAKVEIILGLLAIGVGVFLGQASRLAGGEILWSVAGPGLGLFVLGGYLTLAGHRSHLYQSTNEQTAFLASLIHQLKDEG